MFFFTTFSLFAEWINLKKIIVSNRSTNKNETFRLIDEKLFQDFNRLLTTEKDENDVYRDPERLPCLLVDLDAFDRNIALIRDQMSSFPNKTIRIASKSLRVPYLLKRILSTGLPFKGLMCYAVEEAEFLANLGFDDLLIAYPSEQTIDYRILRKLHDEQEKNVSLVVDNFDSIYHLNEFMSGVRKPFRLILEFDGSFRMFNGKVHIGARRSPIRTIEMLKKMIECVQSLTNVCLEGFMLYESHVAGIGDQNPVNRWLNPLIRYVKSQSIRQLERIRLEMSLIALKNGVKIFNGGGTGSFLSTLKENSFLTELTIGSGFFQPHLFDHYEQNEILYENSGSTFVPSCYFALPIVRTSDPGEWITCLGGGYVASGRPGWDKVPQPIYPRGLSINDDEGMGEVQSPLKIDSKRKNEILNEIQRFPIVYFRHAKGGEIAERFRTVVIVSKGKIVERSRTYRGYEQCFI